MSSERRLPLNQAERLAEELVELLRPACERIAVAGSIRRRKADIGDIELVAVPKDEEALDLFGGRVSVSFDQDQLTDRVCGLLVDNIMAPRKDANGRIRFGSRYKALLYQGVAEDVRQWAIEWGDHPLMRICVAGYEQDGYDFPPSWECVPWRARGGYGSQGNGQARENSHKERLWFSPHTLRPNRPVQAEMAL